MVGPSAIASAPFYHFSIDDVFDSFIEVSDSQLPLFKHPFFRFLKSIHEKYDATIALYLFYQKEIHGRLRTLAEVSDANKCALRTNPWLRLGPHALDYVTPPYAQSPAEQRKVFDAIYAEIDRFAGNEIMSKWVRLHYFSESYELAKYFRARGVEALLATDKDAVSYRLSIPAKERLRAKDAVDYEGMTFRRTHLRVETLVHERTPSLHEIWNLIEPFLTRSGCMVVMTHEYELMRPEIQAVTASIFRYFKEHDVSSVETAPQGI